MHWSALRILARSWIVGGALTSAIGPGLLPLAAADPIPRTVQASELLRHTRTLASDEFEGRGPGSAGEEKAVQYVAAQFAASGLRPGGPDGTWFQPVPIVGIDSTVTATWNTGAGTRPIELPQDAVLWSPRTEPEVRVPECEVVFVGYGVHAPEYGWDDYKGVDVRGKTVVMLVNDPPVPDPAKPGGLDPNVFQGIGMTYYGRWTYKFEEAARRGAAAALLIHETRAAAYPWFVVVNSWGRTRFELDGDPDPKCPVAGWLSQEGAKPLLAAAGLRYEEALALAVRRDFTPRTLPWCSAAGMRQAFRPVASRNVVGIVPGTDRRLREEFVVFTAHWDHLGVDPRREGDRIFNGAADNAVGVAGLLELARTLSTARAKPRRSMLFAALTAEEQGLLGARHYVMRPPRPIASTVANLNIDGLNTWGRTRDVRQIGAGHSTLDEALGAVVRSRGRTLLGDPHPERGLFFRSDHFEFLKGGVPALYLKSGDDYRDHPAGYGEARVNEYVENDYHKVTDEVKADWDLRGAAEDLEILREVGLRVANAKGRPAWKKGSEFAR